MHVLKKDERKPPCGTPVLNWRCVDVVFLTVVFASFDVVCNYGARYVDMYEYVNEFINIHRVKYLTRVK